jgi:tetratricopeptide (TPR) repeat protein
MGFSMLKNVATIIVAALLVGAVVQPAVSIEDPSSRRDRLQREAQNLPSQALEALNKQDADTAIKLYTKAIDSGAFKSQPEMMGQLYFGRGQAYRLKQDCVAAIADFDKAAELVKKGDIYYLRAGCYLELNQEDKALADFDLAIQTDPQAAAYRKGRCIMLFNKKDYARAIPDCDAALTAAPDDKVLLLAASQAAEQTGNRARAAELYRKLMTIDPGNPVATEGLKRVGG